MAQQWNDTDRGNQRILRKIYPGATLSTRNPTWTGLSGKPGLRGEKPETNRLSYCTALSIAKETLSSSSKTLFEVTKKLSLCLKTGIFLWQCEKKLMKLINRLREKE
jgi:hypothetical protein